VKIEQFHSGVPLMIDFGSAFQPPSSPRVERRSTALHACRVILSGTRVERSSTRGERVERRESLEGFPFHLAALFHMELRMAQPYIEFREAQA
jgi:hypothetical protein